MLVECKPCFAIDTLCALAHNKYCREDITEIRRCVESIGENLDIIPSVWSLNIALSNNMPFSEIEKLSIFDLQRIYPPLMDTLDSIIPSKAGVSTALERMMQSNFEQKWKLMCLPVIKRWCDDFTHTTEKINFGNIFSDIKKLKASDKEIDKILVYISYFSYPTSFQLSSNVYVTCCDFGEKLDEKGLIRLMIHELSHGFLNEETEKYYLHAVNNDPFLKQTNWFLKNFRGSFNEEEFVVSMEHAIAVKNAVESYDDAKQILFKHYGSCMPIAVIVFDLLMKENSLPYDLNAWLIECFKTGKIEVGNIKKQVDSILPCYSDSFFKILEETN